MNTQDLHERKTQYSQKGILIFHYSPPMCLIIENDMTLTEPHKAPEATWTWPWQNDTVDKIIKLKIYMQNFTMKIYPALWLYLHISGVS